MSANRRKRTRSAGIVRPRTARPSASISATARATALPVERVERAGERPDEVERQRRDQEAHRRHDAGAERLDHARGAGGCGRPRRRARARRRRRRTSEPLRVLAALDRVDARGARHVLVDDLMDAPRGLLDRIEPERRRDALGDRAPRRRPGRAASGRRGRSRGRGSRARGRRRSRSARCRRARSRPGPGSAPALVRARPASRPSASTRAMEPPPAPISIISMTGTLIGQAAALLEAVAAVDLELAARSAARRPRSRTPWRWCRPCRTRAGPCGRGSTP